MPSQMTSRSDSDSDLTPSKSHPQQHLPATVAAFEARFSAVLPTLGALEETHAIPVQPRSHSSSTHACHQVVMSDEDRILCDMILTALLYAEAEFAPEAMHRLFAHYEALDIERSASSLPCDPTSFFLRALGLLRTRHLIVKAKSGARDSRPYAPHTSVLSKLRPFALTQLQAYWAAQHNLDGMDSVTVDEVRPSCGPPLSPPPPSHGQFMPDGVAAFLVSGSLAGRIVLATPLQSDSSSPLPTVTAASAFTASAPEAPRGLAPEPVPVPSDRNPADVIKPLAAREGCPVDQLMALYTAVETAGRSGMSEEQLGLRSPLPPLPPPPSPS